MRGEERSKKWCTQFDDDTLASGCAAAIDANAADGTDNAMLMTDEATIIGRRRRRLRLAVMSMMMEFTSRLSTGG